MKNVSKEIGLIELCFSGHHQEKKYQQIETGLLNNLIYTIKEQNNIFNRMQEIPKRATDLAGNFEDFSVPVLVFDKSEHNFCEIGYYNFDTKEWSHFGENSMRLICWCYLPNPSEFIKNNRLEYVLHKGYCP